MALEVPPKKEIVVYAPLTAKQEALYTAVVNKTIAKVLGMEKVMLHHRRVSEVFDVVSAQNTWLTGLFPARHLRVRKNNGK